MQSQSDYQEFSLADSSHAARLFGGRISAIRGFGTGSVVVTIRCLITALFVVHNFAQSEELARPRLEGKVVVSGFEPFGGRAENASWILADGIKKIHPEVNAVLIPVVWGAPLSAIREAQPLPSVWIAFGEGTPDFRIEIQGRNQRGQSPDNTGGKPQTPEIVSGGESILRNQVDAAALSAALEKAGFPVQVSRNAGAYLCEEMLYSLLHTQKEQPNALRLVLFIHVPRLGQIVSLPSRKDGQVRISRKLDAEWLGEFGKQLFIALRDLRWIETPDFPGSARW